MDYSQIVDTYKRIKSISQIDYNDPELDKYVSDCFNIVSAFVADPQRYLIATGGKYKWAVVNCYKSMRVYKHKNKAFTFHREGAILPEQFKRPYIVLMYMRHYYHHVGDDDAVYGFDYLDINITQNNFPDYDGKINYLSQCIGIDLSRSLDLQGNLESAVVPLANYSTAIWWMFDTLTEQQKIAFYLNPTAFIRRGVNGREKYDEMRVKCSLPFRKIKTFERDLY